MGDQNPPNCLFDDVIYERSNCLPIFASIYEEIVPPLNIFNTLAYGFQSAFRVNISNGYRIQIHNFNLI